MSDKDYIKDLEKRNEELSAIHDAHAIMLDIIKAKVNIVDCHIFNNIHPKQICSYIETLGWTMKYEKTHERFLTRCYLSPHKDAKVKVFMQDLYAASPSTPRVGANDSINTKIKEIISLLARIHKKGEMEVVFEILTHRRS